PRPRSGPCPGVRSMESFERSGRNAQRLRVPEDAFVEAQDPQVGKCLEELERGREMNGIERTNGLDGEPPARALQDLLADRHPHPRRTRAPEDPPDSLGIPGLDLALSLEPEDGSTCLGEGQGGGHDASGRIHDGPDLVRLSLAYEPRQQRR